MKKWLKMNETTPQPLKIQYRSELIAKLKENKIKEAENVDVVLPEETYVLIYYLHISLAYLKFFNKNEIFFTEVPLG